MQPYRPVFAVLLSTLFVFTLEACSSPEPGAAPAAPPAPAPDRAADEAAIRARTPQAVEAINSRNFAAFASQFTTDGDAIFPGTAKATGRAAIQQLIETGWAKAPKERHISVTIDNIRFVADDVAVVDLSATFSVGEPSKDRATAVVVRNNGEWQTAILRVYAAMNP